VRQKSPVYLEKAAKNKKIELIVAELNANFQI
jgi:hypothetical protein